MNTQKRKEPELINGDPLAVCINDCQLDYGQPYSELLPKCFLVRCAFAPMRWGPPAAGILEANSPPADEAHTDL